MKNIQEFLESINILSEVKENTLVVNRNSIVNFYSDKNEEEAYQAMLLDINTDFPNKRFYWSCKDDNSLYLSSIY